MVGARGLDVDLDQARAGKKGQVKPAGRGAGQGQQPRGPASHAQ